MDFQALLDKKKEEFIRTRYETEQKVNTYMYRVLSAKEQEPSWFTDVTFPEGSTAQEILPSMYTEPFNEENYEKEVEALVAFAKQIEVITERINQEAERCLSM